MTEAPEFPNIPTSSSSTLTPPLHVESRFRRTLATLDRVLIDDFHPSVFTTVMGTGISANILSNFPYPAQWLVVCSYIMFGLSLSLFLSTTTFMVLCCIRYPQNIKVYNTEQATSVFMGCFAMGFGTLVNYINFLVKDCKHGPIAVFVLWWIAVAMALYTACITFYYSYVAKMPNHTFSLEDMHITLLMPIVTLTVVGSSGNLIALELPTVNLKVLTMVISFVLWSNAVVIAFIITTLYFFKLFVHKIPNTSMVFSSFLPVGFLGQGAYCILLFGKNCHTLAMELGVTSHYFSYLTESELASAKSTASIIGNCALVVSALAGLLLLSFGYFMTFLSVISVLSKIAPFTANPNPMNTKHGLIKFSRGFWSMTFPLGTMALGNTQFYRTFGDGFVFFRAMGTTYAVAVIIITVGCLSGMIYRLIRILLEDDVESKV